MEAEEEEAGGGGEGELLDGRGEPCQSDRANPLRGIFQSHFSQCRRVGHLPRRRSARP